jgi:hypothetical protein
MAEFSKQYVQNFESEIGGWDFDIEEIAKDLEPEHYTPYICEGFGFVAIGKDENHKIILGFRNSQDEIDWKTIEETIKIFK